MQLLSVIASRLTVLTLVSCVLFCALPGTAQERNSARRRTSTLAPQANSNRQITQIVREIDPRNIEASVRKLVSFGTRNTLSSQNDLARGIGAARDWLFAEFSKVSAQSGGRMTVEKQTFEQPKATRIPTPTMITNVVATLKGLQPESAGRTYVVSGHYDSMCTSPTDGTCDAPGANDDASGTAAVLEMARVMAPHKFDATIIFMAVAGEEQGLLGATYFAEQANQKGMDIEAMFTNDIVGNSLGGNGVRDARSVRLFSEGVPSNETEAEANTRRGPAANRGSGRRGVSMDVLAESREHPAGSEKNKAQLGRERARGARCHLQSCTSARGEL